MKVAVFGTIVSDDFVPVLQDFFQFLKTNQIEVQLYEPFFKHLTEDLKTTPYFTSFFQSYTDFEMNLFSVLEVTVLFYNRF